MTFTLSTVFYIIAVFLLALAALPPISSYPLLSAGLAFLAAGHVAG